MGLNVELFSDDQPAEGQRRPQHAPLATVADSRVRFADAIERAQRDGSEPILDRIDLYGSSVLPSEAMPELRLALARMIADAADEDEHKVLEAVDSLAERCQDEVDLFLRFIGD